MLVNTCKKAGEIVNCIVYTIFETCRKYLYSFKLQQTEIGYKLSESHCTSSYNQHYTAAITFTICYVIWLSAWNAGPQNFWLCNIVKRSICKENVHPSVCLSHYDPCVNGSGYQNMLCKILQNNVCSSPGVKFCNPEFRGSPG